MSGFAQRPRLPRKNITLAFRITDADAEDFAAACFSEGKRMADVLRDTVAHYVEEYRERQNGAQPLPSKRVPEAERGGEDMSDECTQCRGCGKVANSDKQEAWTYWTELPPGSDLAVRTGLIKPITCPRCGGSGNKPTPPDARADEAR